MQRLTTARDNTANMGKRSLQKQIQTRCSETSASDHASQPVTNLRRISPMAIIETEDQKIRQSRNQHSPFSISGASSQTSSSSSYLEISRTYPSQTKAVRNFFMASSERMRKVKKKKCRASFFRFGCNSSSSSVDSDLAYGTGFIRISKRKSRRRTANEFVQKNDESSTKKPQNGHDDICREKIRSTCNSRSSGCTSSSAVERCQYDRKCRQKKRNKKPSKQDPNNININAEILAIRAGLTKLARDSKIVGHKTTKNRKSSYRGIRSRKPDVCRQTKQQENSDAGEDWESICESDSDSSVDSKLAYGNNSKSYWDIIGWNTSTKSSSSTNFFMESMAYGIIHDNKNMIDSNHASDIVSDTISDEPKGYHTIENMSDSGCYSPNLIKKSKNIPDLAISRSRSPIPTNTADPSSARQKDYTTNRHDPFILTSFPATPLQIVQPKPITPISQSIYESETHLSTEISTAPSNQSIFDEELVPNNRNADFSSTSLGPGFISDRNRVQWAAEKSIELPNKERTQIRERLGSGFGTHLVQNEMPWMLRERLSSRFDMRREDRNHLRDENKVKLEIDKAETERINSEKKMIQRDLHDSRQDWYDCHEINKKRDSGNIEPFYYANSTREYPSGYDNDENDEMREVGISFAAQTPDDVPFRSIKDSLKVYPDEKLYNTHHLRQDSEYLKPSLIQSDRQEIWNEPSGFRMKADRWSHDTNSKESWNNTLDDFERGREQYWNPWASHTIAKAGEAGEAGAVTARKGHELSRSREGRNERRQVAFEHENNRNKKRVSDQSKFSKFEAYNDLERDQGYLIDPSIHQKCSPPINHMSQYIHDTVTHCGSDIANIFTTRNNKQEIEFDEPPDHDYMIDYLSNNKDRMQASDDFPLNSNYLKHEISKRPDSEKSLPSSPTSLTRSTTNNLPSVTERETDTGLLLRSTTRSPDPEPTREDVVDVGLSSIKYPTESKNSKTYTWESNKTKLYQAQSPPKNSDAYLSNLNSHPSKMSEPSYEVSHSDTKKRNEFDSIKNEMKDDVMENVTSGLEASESQPSDYSTRTRHNEDNNFPLPLKNQDYFVEFKSAQCYKKSPKSIACQKENNQIPSDIGEDLDFLAYIAVGLQETGFDPSIAINDPRFRRKGSLLESPTTKSNKYATYAETVSDIDIPPQNTLGSNEICGRLDDHGHESIESIQRAHGYLSSEELATSCSPLTNCQDNLQPQENLSEYIFETQLGKHEEIKESKKENSRSHYPQHCRRGIWKRSDQLELLRQKSAKSIDKGKIIVQFYNSIEIPSDPCVTPQSWVEIMGTYFQKAFSRTECGSIRSDADSLDMLEQLATHETLSSIVELSVKSRKDVMNSTLSTKYARDIGNISQSCRHSIDPSLIVLEWSKAARKMRCNHESGLLRSREMPIEFEIFQQLAKYDTKVILMHEINRNGTCSRLFGSEFEGSETLGALVKKSPASLEIPNNESDEIFINSSPAQNSQDNSWAVKFLLPKTKTGLISLIQGLMKNCILNHSIEIYSKKPISGSSRLEIHILFPEAKEPIGLDKVKVFEDPKASLFTSLNLNHTIVKYNHFFSEFSDKFESMNFSEGTLELVDKYYFCLDIDSRPSWAAHKYENFPEENSYLTWVVKINTISKDSIADLARVVKYCGSRLLQNNSIPDYSHSRSIELSRKPEFKKPEDAYETYGISTLPESSNRLRIKLDTISSDDLHQSAQKIGKGKEILNFDKDIIAQEVAYAAGLHISETKVEPSGPVNNYGSSSVAKIKIKDYFCDPVIKYGQALGHKSSFEVTERIDDPQNLYLSRVIITDGKVTSNNFENSRGEIRSQNDKRFPVLVMKRPARKGPPSNLDSHHVPKGLNQTPNHIKGGLSVIIEFSKKPKILPDISQYFLTNKREAIKIPDQPLKAIKSIKQDCTVCQGSLSWYDNDQNETAAKIESVASHEIPRSEEQTGIYNYENSKVSSLQPDLITSMRNQEDLEQTKAEVQLILQGNKTTTKISFTSNDSAEKIEEEFDVRADQISGTPSSSSYDSASENLTRSPTLFIRTDQINQKFPVFENLPEIEDLEHLQSKIEPLNLSAKPHENLMSEKKNVVNRTLSSIDNKSHRMAVNNSRAQTKYDKYKLPIIKEVITCRNLQQVDFKFQNEEISDMTRREVIFESPSQSNPEKSTPKVEEKSRDKTFLIVKQNFPAVFDRQLISRIISNNKSILDDGRSTWMISEERDKKKTEFDIKQAILPNSNGPLKSEYKFSEDMSGLCEVFWKWEKNQNNDINDTARGFTTLHACLESKIMENDTRLGIINKNTESSLTGNFEYQANARDGTISLQSESRRQQCDTFLKEHNSMTDEVSGKTPMSSFIGVHLNMNNVNEPLLDSSEIMKVHPAKDLKDYCYTRKGADMISMMKELNSLGREELLVPSDTSLSVVLPKNELEKNLENVNEAKLIVDQELVSNYLKRVNLSEGDSLLLNNFGKVNALASNSVILDQYQNTVDVEALVGYLSYKKDLMADNKIFANKNSISNGLPTSNEIQSQDILRNDIDREKNLGKESSGYIQRAQTYAIMPSRKWLILPPVKLDKPGVKENIGQLNASEASKHVSKEDKFHMDEHKDMNESYLHLMARKPIARQNSSKQNKRCALNDSSDVERYNRNTANPEAVALSHAVISVEKSGKERTMIVEKSYVTVGAYVVEASEFKINSGKERRQTHFKAYHTSQHHDINRTEYYNEDDSSAKEPFIAVSGQRYLMEDNKTRVDDNSMISGSAEIDIIKKIKNIQVPKDFIPNANENVLESDGVITHLSPENIWRMLKIEVQENTKFFAPANKSSSFWTCLKSEIMEFIRNPKNTHVLDTLLGQTSDADPRIQNVSCTDLIPNTKTSHSVLPVNLNVSENLSRNFLLAIFRKLLRKENFVRSNTYENRDLRIENLSDVCTFDMGHLANLDLEVPIENSDVISAWHAGSSNSYQPIFAGMDRFNELNIENLNITIELMPSDYGNVAVYNLNFARRSMHPRIFEEFADPREENHFINFPKLNEIASSASDEKLSILIIPRDNFQSGIIKTLGYSEKSTTHLEPIKIKSEPKCKSLGFGEVASSLHSPSSTYGGFKESPTSGLADLIQLGRKRSEEHERRTAAVIPAIKRAKYFQIKKESLAHSNRRLKTTLPVRNFEINRAKTLVAGYKSGVLRRNIKSHNICEKADRIEYKEATIGIQLEDTDEFSHTPLRRNFPRMRNLNLFKNSSRSGHDVRKRIKPGKKKKFPCNIPKASIVILDSRVSKHHSVAPNYPLSLESSDGNKSLGLVRFHKTNSFPSIDNSSKRTTLVLNWENYEFCFGSSYLSLDREKKNANGLAFSAGVVSCEHSHFKKVPSHTVHSNTTQMIILFINLLEHVSKLPNSSKRLNIIIKKKDISRYLAIFNLAGMLPLRIEDAESDSSHRLTLQLTENKKNGIENEDFSVSFARPDFSTVECVKNTQDMSRKKILTVSELKDFLASLSDTLNVRNEIPLKKKAQKSGKDEAKIFSGSESIELDRTNFVRSFYVRNSDYSSISRMSGQNIDYSENINVNLDLLNNKEIYNIQECYFSNFPSACGFPIHLQIKNELFNNKFMHNIFKADVLKDWNLSKRSGSRSPVELYKLLHEMSIREKSQTSRSNFSNKGAQRLGPKENNSILNLKANALASQVLGIQFLAGTQESFLEFFYTSKKPVIILPNIQQGVDEPFQELRKDAIDTADRGSQRSNYALSNEQDGQQSLVGRIKREHNKSFNTSPRHFKDFFLSSIKHTCKEDHFQQSQLLSQVFHTNHNKTKSFTDWQEDAIHKVCKKKSMDLSTNIINENIEAPYLGFNCNPDILWGQFKPSIYHKSGFRFPLSKTNEKLLGVEFMNRFQGLSDRYTGALKDFHWGNASDRATHKISSREPFINLPCRIYVSFDPYSWGRTKPAPELSISFEISSSTRNFPHYFENSHRIFSIIRELSLKNSSTKNEPLKLIEANSVSSDSMNKKTIPLVLFGSLRNTSCSNQTGTNRRSYIEDSNHSQISFYHAWEFLTSIYVERITPIAGLKKTHFSIDFCRPLEILGPELDNQTCRTISKKFTASGSSSSKKVIGEQTNLTSNDLYRISFVPLWPLKIYNQNFVSRSNSGIGTNERLQRRITWKEDERLNNHPSTGMEGDQTCCRESLDLELKFLLPTQFSLNSYPFFSAKSKGTRAKYKRITEKREHSTANEPFHSQPSCSLAFDANKDFKPLLVQAMTYIPSFPSKKMKEDLRNYTIQGGIDLLNFERKNKYFDKSDSIDECIQKKVELKLMEYNPVLKRLADVVSTHISSTFSQNSGKEMEILNANPKLKKRYQSSTEILATFELFRFNEDLSITKSNLDERFPSLDKSNYQSLRLTGYPKINDFLLYGFQPQKIGTKNVDRSYLYPFNSLENAHSNVNRMRVKTTHPSKENEILIMLESPGQQGSDSLNLSWLSVLTKNDSGDKNLIKRLINPRKIDVHHYPNIQSSRVILSLRAQVPELNFHELLSKDGEKEESSALAKFNIEQTTLKTNPNGKKSCNFQGCQFDYVNPSEINIQKSQFSSNLIISGMPTQKEDFHHIKIFLSESHSSVNGQSLNARLKVPKFDSMLIRNTFNTHKRIILFAMVLRGIEHFQPHKGNLNLLPGRNLGGYPLILHDNFRCWEEIFNRSMTFLSKLIDGLLLGGFIKRVTDDDLSKEIKSLQGRFLATARDLTSTEFQAATTYFLTKFPKFETLMTNDIDSHDLSYSQSLLKIIANFNSVYEKITADRIICSHRNQKSIFYGSEDTQRFAQPSKKLRHQKAGNFSKADSENSEKQQSLPESSSYTLLSLRMKERYVLTEKKVFFDIDKLLSQICDKVPSLTKIPIAGPQNKLTFLRSTRPFEQNPGSKVMEMLGETLITQFSSLSDFKRFEPKIRSTSTFMGQISRHVSFGQFASIKTMEKKRRGEKVQEAEKPVADLKYNLKSVSGICFTENIILPSEHLSIDMTNQFYLTNRREISPAVFPDNAWTKLLEQKKQAPEIDNYTTKKNITKKYFPKVDVTSKGNCNNQLKRKTIGLSKRSEICEVSDSEVSCIIEPNLRQDQETRSNILSKDQGEMIRTKVNQDRNENNRAFLGDKLWEKSHIYGSLQDKMIPGEFLSKKGAASKKLQEDIEYPTPNELQISKDSARFKESPNTNLLPILLPQTSETNVSEIPGNKALPSSFHVNQIKEPLFKTILPIIQDIPTNRLTFDKNDFDLSNIDESILQTDLRARLVDNPSISHSKVAPTTKLSNEKSPSKSTTSRNIPGDSGNYRCNSKDELSITISSRYIPPSDDKRTRTFDKYPLNQNVSDRSCFDEKKHSWQYDGNESNELSTLGKDLITEVQNVADHNLSSCKKLSFNTSDPIQTYHHDLMESPECYANKNTTLPEELCSHKSPLKINQFDFDQFSNLPFLEVEMQPKTKNNMNEYFHQKKSVKNSLIIPTATSPCIPSTKKVTTFLPESNLITTRENDKNFLISESHSTIKSQAKHEAQKECKSQSPAGSRDENLSQFYKSSLQENSDSMISCNQGYSIKHFHPVEKARRDKPVNLRCTSNDSCSIKYGDNMKKIVLNSGPSNEDCSIISKKIEISEISRLSGRNQVFGHNSTGLGTEKSTRVRNLQIGPQASHCPTSRFNTSQIQISEQASNLILDSKPVSKICRLQTTAQENPEFRNSFPSPRSNCQKNSGARRNLGNVSQQNTKPHSSQETLTTLIPQPNEGRVRSKGMTDVYDGIGEGYMSSPRSPTRPHSLRRRQSMKVLELERKVEQLSEKNRVLIEDKEKIEKYVKLSLRTSLNDKDTEINALKHTISSLQEEVSRSTKLSRSLNKPNSVVARQNLERNTVDEDHHTKVLQELKQARDALHRLNINMQNEIKHVISTKDNDIAGLRAELNTANQKIQETQKQLLLSKEIDKEYLNLKDDSYFENACQRLCQHVQHWVLRFSKSSDVKSCKLMSEIDDESIIERLDNTILDGIDVDIYLSNRVKRRDVLMSMVMTMISEFIFTRYLFGMDRDERQKLKYLEKTLLEVGPAPAVHSWRAITLSLLSKRLAFIQQRDEDIEAVVAVILETLSEILPPPTNIKKQIEEQLTRVIREAACLAIDMRCQKAEYIMLPHKQPEYDSNCKIKSKILFDAAHMNECSDDSESKIFLEDSQAVVRIVLFPLIVRKCDTGESNKDIVIWPAQVLVAKSAKLIFDDDDIHSKFSSKSNIPSVQNE